MAHGKLARMQAPEESAEPSLKDQVQALMTWISELEGKMVEVRDSPPEERQCYLAVLGSRSKGYFARMMTTSGDSYWHQTAKYGSLETAQLAAYHWAAGEGYFVLPGKPDRAADMKDMLDELDKVQRRAETLDDEVSLLERGAIAPPSESKGEEST